MLCAELKHHNSTGAVNNFAFVTSTSFITPEFTGAANPLTNTADDIYNLQNTIPSNTAVLVTPDNSGNWFVEHNIPANNTLPLGPSTVVYIGRIHALDTHLKPGST